MDGMFDAYYRLTSERRYNIISTFLASDKREESFTSCYFLGGTIDGNSMGVNKPVHASGAGFVPFY